MENSLVRIENVRKTYEGKGDEELTILKGINFTIEQGEIFALIGHNGAGKTSLIKILLGLSNPTSGSIFVNSLKVGHNPKVKEFLGYVPEKIAFPPTLNAIEVLRFYGRIRGVSAKRCDEVLEQVGLQPYAQYKVRTFSKGMTQRLGVAQALLAKPQLIVLDEPTSGLDPIGVAQFKQLMRELKADGLSILFTTHILNEVEQLADRVGIMGNGELYAVDALEHLLNHSGILPRFELELTGAGPEVITMVKAEGANEVQWDGQYLRVACVPEKKIAILEAVQKAGGKIRDIRDRQPSLEDLFIRWLSATNTPTS